jgi:hypothetical protein
MVTHFRSLLDFLSSEFYLLALVELLYPAFYLLVVRLDVWLHIRLYIRDQQSSYRKPETHYPDTTQLCYTQGLTFFAFSSRALRLRFPGQDLTIKNSFVF